jgi:hypothetical protein
MLQHRPIQKKWPTLWPQRLRNASLFTTRGKRIRTRFRQSFRPPRRISRRLVGTAARKSLRWHVRRRQRRSSMRKTPAAATGTLEPCLSSQRTCCSRRSQKRTQFLFLVFHILLKKIMIVVNRAIVLMFDDDVCVFSFFCPLKEIMLVELP